MSGAVYSGDDIGAVVFDMGSNTIRVGYAGEEYPRLDVPSYCMVYEENNEKKIACGTVGIHSKKPAGVLREPHAVIIIGLRNVVVEGLMQVCKMHILKSSLQFKWIVQSKREQLAELLFEKYNTPAVHLAKSAMLVGLANARPTCLVVDCGATHTTAVPVHDGIVLAQAIAKSPAGSDYVIEQTKRMFREKNIEVVPYYRVASKEIVKPEEPALWKEKYFKATTSWNSYMVKEVLQDFHSTVLQISDTQFDEEIVKTIPAVHYEFPNGFHKDFGVERFKVAEPLFNLTARSSNGIQPSLDISSLITTSVGMCDIDTRPLMYANVIITGGNSNIQGFTERLTKDLQSKVPPSMRLKVIPQNGSIDRRFAPWLGGAILASLGNFHSFWVSRQEYDEVGKVIIHSRC